MRSVLSTLGRSEMIHRTAWNCLYVTMVVTAVVVTSGSGDVSGRGPIGTQSSPISTAQESRPVTHRIIALAEPGQTLHQPFADAAMQWLQATASSEGFAIDYI